MKGFKICKNDLKKCYVYGDMRIVCVRLLKIINIFSVKLFDSKNLPVCSKCNPLLYISFLTMLSLLINEILCALQISNVNGNI